MTKSLGQIVAGDTIELHGEQVRVTRGAHRPFDNDQVRIQYTRPGLDGGFNYTGPTDEPIRVATD